MIVENYLSSFEINRDFLPLGCCGTCRKNLSLRFGKTPSEKYKPFPCESNKDYYQNVIEKLKKLPRGNGSSTECNCEVICKPAHKNFESVKLDPGRPSIPKPELPNNVSRDRKTLDQSRSSEVAEVMEKWTPKTKDALVYARLKEKQEEKNTSESPLSFGSARGGRPLKVFPEARKKLYDSKAPVSKKTLETSNLLVPLVPLVPWVESHGEPIDHWDQSF